MIYVTLRFDDGTKSQYAKAYKYMMKYNLPGSIYVVGKYIENDAYSSQYVRLDELKEMQENGWEVGYHSYSHDKTWIDDKKTYKKETDKTFLVENGINVGTFALPHSVYNHDVIKYLQDQYDGILGIPSNVGNSMEYLPFNKLFRSITVTREVTLDSIIDKIKNAIENNMYIILLFHRIELGPSNLWSFPIKRFHKLIKVLSQFQQVGLIEVKTFNNVVKEITNG